MLYCIWLVLLIKLVLPPGLSLPTGIGYWFRGYSADAVSRRVEDIFTGEHSEVTVAEVPPVSTDAIEAEMTMKFKSTSLSGEMGIVLLGTQNLVPRYRLNLRPDHSKDKPIEVLRESNSRQFVVGAATKFPVINDGNFHTLKFLKQKKVHPLHQQD